MKTKLRNQKGFTIIEVLIVLAIAGLILLIVFLAVPALQRNSRNTQYRSEASRLLGAYQEISNNNSGNVLTASASSTAGSNAEDVFKAANPKNITLFTISAQGAGDVVVGATPDAKTVNVNSSLLRTKAKCASAISGVDTAGTTRQVAMYYVVETSSGTQLQCQDS